MTHKLTQAQQALLERYRDGDLTGVEAEQAKELLAQAPEATTFVSALAEVELAARGASQASWEQARAPQASQVASVASASADEVMTQPLEALAPLLERFHDGEVDAHEIALVDELLMAREDVADYLVGLDELQLGLGAGLGELELPAQDVFWASLEARLAPARGPKVLPFPSVAAQPSTAERPAFNLEHHLVMLYRCHDGEATAQERAQVSAWAEIDPQVAQRVSALDELRLSAQVACDAMQEPVEWSTIWQGVSAQLGEEAPGVVSLAKAREARRFGGRRELAAAVAAMLCAGLGLGLFADRLLGPREIKTIVIVDSVEYSGGATGRISGQSLQPASLTSPAMSRPEAAEPGEPTIIWLLEPAEGDAPPATPGAPEEEAAQREKKKRKLKPI